MPAHARIDAHQHFWRPARGDYGWLRPGVPAVAPLLRDYEPADLQPLLQAHGVVRTVLVQAAQSVAETDFMLSLADAHDFIGGVVGWVDLADPASVATLERWAANPKFKGVRPMLQELADANWIARAPHPEVMRALGRLNLRFDALVKPPHLAGLLRFLRAWPGLPVVVDHAAKPRLAEGWQGAWAPAWRQGLAEVAALPNVVCKVSGLLTECAPAQVASPDAAVSTLGPVWHELLQRFGPARLMWGSDWPVLTLADSYAGWVGVSDALIDDLSPDEQDAVRQRCAARFYALDGVA